MTSTKRFAVRGRRVAKKPYLYRASGLDDVYLLNGFKLVETAYGSGVEIQDIPGLHRAIAYHLVTESKPLTSREFRFLRKHMDLTQEVLAERLRVDAQTVARYEKGQTAIPGPADFVLRMMFALDATPKDRREDVLADLKTILGDERYKSKTRVRRDFERTADGWNAGSRAH